MGDVLEELKNSIVIPMYKEGDNQQVENYRAINMLNACYRLYSNILSEKNWKQLEEFLLECQNEFQKGRFALIHRIAWHYWYQKKKEKV